MCSLPRPRSHSRSCGKAFGKDLPSGIRAGEDSQGRSIADLVAALRELTYLFHHGKPAFKSLRPLVERWVKEQFIGSHAFRGSDIFLDLIE